MKNQLLFIALLLAGMAAFTGCASLTGFQDGRAVGEDNSELGLSLNYSESPDLNKLKDEAEDSTNISIPLKGFPFIEASFRYGVTDKLDIGVRLNSNLNLGVSGKYQIVGDQESPFAMALGAEIATFGLFVGLWNVQVPLYLSVHPSERLAIYLTPRYTYQFSTFAGAEYGLSYVGANAGIMFGERTKFGFDIGYHDVSATEGSGSIGLLQFGLGARIPLGGGGGRN